MIIRSTICTLALVAGAAVSGCNSEKNDTPTQTREGVNEAAPLAALTGFGMHIGSYEQADGLTETWTTPERFGAQTLYYDPDPFVTGEHIAAFSDSRDEGGNPAVGLRLTDEGAELLRATTTDRIGEPIVLTVDGEVVSAPTVQSVISRVAQVSGSGEAAWIERLETILAEAGAEKVDRLSDENPREPELGMMILVAGPERTAEMQIDFPLLGEPILYFDPTPLLTSEHFSGATVTTDQAGNPALELTLNEAGRAILDARVDDYIGNYLIAAWEGRAISASRVLRELEGRLLITESGIDPELSENWMADIEESFPQ